VGYCERQDVYALGLDAAAFARPARRVEGVDLLSGTLSLRSHGLALGAALTLSVLSSSTLGAPTATLPAPLAVGHVYGAAPLSADALQLRDAPGTGGALISTFISKGHGVIGLVPDSGADLDAAIDAATTLIDQYARAHAAPMQAAALRLVCAYVSARIYVSAHAAMNPAYAEALEGPSWLRGLIDKLFAAWMAGAPILGAVDASPDVAEMGPRVLSTRGGPFGPPRAPGLSRQPEKNRV
jgi:hypothetical protein